MIVAEDDIKYPVELVFDAPMAADGLSGSLGCEIGRGDIIAGLEPAAILKFSLAFDLDDGSNVGQAQFTGEAVVAVQPVDLARQRDGALFDAAKGKKDRMIPIGERALEWVGKYREGVRPDFACGADDGTLFLTTQGEAFAAGRMTQLVRNYVTAADLGKRGSCHLFRHSMATLMLENGADIRFIQAMLGHAELSTTEIYTQVSIRMLKHIHTATHPARPRKTRAADQHASAPADPDHARRALLAALDAEAEEEE